MLKLSWVEKWICLLRYHFWCSWLQIWTLLLEAVISHYFFFIFGNLKPSKRGWVGFYVNTPVGVPEKTAFVRKGLIKLREHYLLKETANHNGRQNRPLQRLSRSNWLSLIAKPCWRKDLSCTCYCEGYVHQPTTKPMKSLREIPVLDEPDYYEPEGRNESKSSCPSTFYFRSLCTEESCRPNTHTHTPRRCKEKWRWW